MFAAIYIPDFPVEAMTRAEPELRAQAVAVVEGTPPLVRVIAVNEGAAQAGIETGMTKLEAEAIVAALRSSCESGKTPTLSRAKQGRDKGGAPIPTSAVVRERSGEREATAHAALLDCACGFSPRVEDTAADTVVLDIAGLERIFGPPAKLAREVARRCSEIGLEANVAVASNADTAVLAARGFAGVTIIPEGKEAERLGELSVEVLLVRDWATELTIVDCRLPIEHGSAPRGTPLEILETLEKWGVRNLRALAALPAVAVAERLGQAGVYLQKLARGEARRALVVAEPPLVFEEAAELEYPLAMLEPLAFVLNRMLEQLCARLASRALAANELKLTLTLGADVEDREIGGSRGIENPAEITGSPDHVITRCLRLPVPMLDAKVFLKLLQLDLQAHPPQAAVAKVRLRAEPSEPRRTQNGMFVPQAPEAEKLELTIAKIKKVVGASPALRVPTCGGSQLPVSPDTDETMVGEPRVGSPEILDTHQADGWRMQPFAAGEGACATPPSCITALRVYRPALAAVVTLRDGRPTQVACPERPAMRGEVVWCAGPWRSSGEWWSEQAWARAEWDVVVRNEEGVALYRIYHDEMGGKWWVEGTYD